MCSAKTLRLSSDQKQMRCPPEILKVSCDRKHTSFDFSIKLLAAVEKMFASVRSSRKMKFNMVLQQIRCDDPSLQEIDFDFFFNKRPNQKGLTKLFQSLRYNTSLQQIYLNGNKINDQSALTLADVLPTTALLTIHLNSNVIEYQGAIAISKALSNSTTTIETLSLTDNFIGDAGAIEIAKGLSKNTSLRRLNLMKNNIGDRGATALAEALCINATLQSLKIGSDTGIGDQSSFAFSKMLATRNVTLLRLAFNRCTIGNQGIAALGAALSTNKTLHSLSVEYNNIEDEGVLLFTKNLKNNRTLRKINILGNKFREKGMQELVKSGFYRLPPNAPMSIRAYGCVYYSWRALACVVGKDGRYPMHVAASNSLKWESGLKYIVEANYLPLIETDPTTGLYPFMLTAAGQNADLEATYQLLRLHPGPMQISV